MYISMHSMYCAPVIKTKYTCMAPSIISHNKFTVDIGNIKRSAMLRCSGRSLSRRSAIDWIFCEWHFRKSLI